MCSWYCERSFSITFSTYRGCLCSFIYFSWRVESDGFLIIEGNEEGQREAFLVFAVVATPVFNSVLFINFILFLLKAMLSNWDKSLQEGKSLRVELISFWSSGLDINFYWLNYLNFYFCLKSSLFESERSD